MKAGKIVQRIVAAIWRAAVLVMKTINTIILLLVGWTAAVFAAELRPVDEAAKDPSFREFRSQLLRAVERKDRKYLMDILAQDILNSFGGAVGKDEFARQWQLNSPNSEVWNELKWILIHGGSFEPDGNFCAPYVYTRWPSDNYWLEYVAVVRNNVPIRKARSVNSIVIGRLNYTIVKVVDEKWPDKRSEQLVKVKTDSREGFVSRTDLRSPIDWRACFEKRQNRWLMVNLVAGD